MNINDYFVFDFSTSPSNVDDKKGNSNIVRFIFKLELNAKIAHKPSL